MKNELDRRSFLTKTGILAGASLLVPHALFAEPFNEKTKTVSLTSSQGDGFYTKKVGNKEITVISDGSLYFPDGFFAQEATESQNL